MPSRPTSVHSRQMRSERHAWLALGSLPFSFKSRLPGTDAASRLAPTPHQTTSASGATVIGRVKSRLSCIKQKWLNVTDSLERKELHVVRAAHADNDFFFVLLINASNPGYIFLNNLLLTDPQSQSLSSQNDMTIWSHLFDVHLL